MPATYQTNGAFNALQPGNDTGFACTGIGVGANASGPNPQNDNFTDTAAAFAVPHIGGGLITGAGSSDSNTGQIIVNAVPTAGSGYTNGTYDFVTTGGGAGAQQGVVRVVVAAGAIASAYIVNAGGRFTATPTVVLTGMGAGSGGAVVLSVGYTSLAYALGRDQSQVSWGANKGMRRITATGAVADNGVIVSGWLNRSGRAMVSGESAWAVAA